MDANVASYNASTVLLGSVRSEVRASESDLKKIEKYKTKSNKNVDDFLKNNVPNSYLQVFKDDDVRSCCQTVLANRETCVPINYQFQPLKLTLLHVAAYYSSNQNISLLLQQPEINVNSQNSEGETPLMLAVTTSKSDAVAYNCAVLLCQHDSIDVSKTTKNSSFPLVHAVRRGFVKTAKFLYSKRFQTQYKPKQIAYVIKAAAFWEKNDIGCYLLGNLRRDILKEIEKLLFPRTLQFLNSKIQALETTPTVPDGDDATGCVDSRGRKLNCGYIVEVLSEQNLRWYLPELHRDMASSLAGQRGLIHHIAGDSLYIKTILSDELLVLHPRAVKFVAFGPSLKISDRSTITMGGYVVLIANERDFRRMNLKRYWTDGMERLTGSTGRVMNITNAGLLEVQFPANRPGDTVLLPPTVLAGSTEDQVSDLYASSTPFKRGCPMRLCSSIEEFNNLQAEIGLSPSDSDIQLLDKLVVLDKIIMVPTIKHKLLEVIWEEERYWLNADALSPIFSTRDPSDKEIYFGSRVKLVQVASTLQSLQTPAFGGHVEEMLYEREGIAVGFAANPFKDTSQPLVKINFAARSFYVNPKCLIVLTPKDNDFHNTAPYTSGPQIIERDCLQCLELLGEGGYGKVYKGLWDNNAEGLQFVAIKQLRYNFAINSSMSEGASEADIQHSLKHPNIVRLHGVSYEFEEIWLVMDYIPGKNLFSLLFQSTPREKFEVSGKVKLDMCRDIASTIAYIHSQGYIHRDIKPQNIMIQEATKQVYICDFGITRYVGNMDILTLVSDFTDQFAGTIFYIAPECLWKNKSGSFIQHSQRSDVWSLGAVLYEILTGSRLFDNQISCLKVKFRNESNVIQKMVNRNVPRQYRSILKKALSFNLRKRPTAQAIADFFRDAQLNVTSNIV